MRLKRVICPWLCVAMLAACTPGADDGTGVLQQEAISEAGMGRYVEETWELPEEIDGSSLMLVRLADGRFLIAANDDGEDGGTLCFTTADGQRWQRETPDWLEQCSERGYWVLGLSCNAQGDMAIGYRDRTGEEAPFGVAIYRTDGTLTEVPLDGEEAAQAAGSAFEPFPQDILLGDDGNLYLPGRFRGAMMVFAGDGSFLHCLPDGDGTYAAGGEYFVRAVYENSTGMAGGADRSGVVVYAAGELDAPPEIVACDDMNRVQDALAVTQEGSLYLLNAGGIYRRVPGGTVWVKLLDGSLSTLGLGMPPAAVIAHGDGELLVALRGSESVIYNYRYDPETPAVPSTELVIYTLGQDPTLNWGVHALHRQRPDVFVNVMDRYEQNSGAGADDAIRAINTELLAGKGPDLFVLDSMPVESFIQKGVLADLSDLVGPMIESGELLQGIAGAYEQDGKIPAVPVRFTVPTLWGDKEFIAACTDLSSVADYAEAHPDKQLFYGAELRDILDLFFYSCSPGWTWEGAVDEAVIAGFLTDIKRILAVQADKTPVMLSDAPANVAAGELEACRAVLHGFWSVWEPNGAVAARYGVVVDPQADERITSLPLPEVRECYALLPGQAQGVYFARSVIGVNANSDQQELAMEFLRCMLSAEVQDNDLSDGFPMRRSSWMYNLQKTNRSTVEIPMDEGAFVYAQPAGYVYEDLLQRFETLQTPVENDAELYSEVETQMERLLAGDTGAEEAAEVIASKINLRLTEAG